MNEADEIGAGFQSSLGVLAGVAILAMVDGRAASATRAARRARGHAAAHAARARVAAGTVVELRAQLEEAVEDLEDADARIENLLSQVARLTADRATLATALQARRAA